VQAWCRRGSVRRVQAGQRAHGGGHGAARLQRGKVLSLGHGCMRPIFGSAAQISQEEGGVVGELRRRRRELAREQEGAVA